MEKLLMLLVLVLAAAILLMIRLAVREYFIRPALVVRAALSFVGGLFIGGALIGTALAFFMPKHALDATWEVMVYLMVLAATGLATGVALSWSCIKAGRTQAQHGGEAASRPG